MERRFVISPDGFESADLFFKLSEALRPVNAMMFCFFPVPASANPENDPAIREDVESCYRFGCGERVSFDLE